MLACVTRFEGDSAERIRAAGPARGDGDALVGTVYEVAAEARLS